MHSEVRIKNQSQKTKLVILSLFLIAIIICPLRVFATEDRIVAIVSGEAITRRDIEDYLAALYFQLSLQYDKDTVDSKIRRAEVEALDVLIENKLIIQEAKRQGLEADPYIVESRLEDIKSRFPSEKEFYEGLLSKGLSPADLKKKISNKMLMHDMVEKEVRSKIFVHPQEVTDYYQSHIEDFKTEEQIDLDSIFIPFDGSERKAKNIAYKVLALLKKGEDFSKVQKEYSQTESLGPVKRSHLKKEIANVVLNLNIGEISLPIRMEDGFFVLKVRNIVPPYKRKLSDVQDVIYGYLFQKKFEKKFIEWTDELKKEAFILVK